MINLMYECPIRGIVTVKCYTYDDYAKTTHILEARGFEYLEETL